MRGETMPREIPEGLWVDVQWAYTGLDDEGCFRETRCDIDAYNGKRLIATVVGRSQRSARDAPDKAVGRLYSYRRAFALLRGRILETPNDLERWGEYRRLLKVWIKRHRVRLRPSMVREGSRRVRAADPTDLWKLRNE